MENHEWCKKQENISDNTSTWYLSVLNITIYLLSKSTLFYFLFSYACHFSLHTEFRSFVLSCLAVVQEFTIFASQTSGAKYAGWFKRENCILYSKTNVIIYFTQCNFKVWNKCKGELYTPKQWKNFIWTWVRKSSSQVTALFSFPNFQHSVTLLLFTLLHLEWHQTAEAWEGHGAKTMQHEINFW